MTNQKCLVALNAILMNERYSILRKTVRGGQGKQSAGEKNYERKNTSPSHLTNRKNLLKEKDGSMINIKSEEESTPREVVFMVNIKSSTVTTVAARNV